MTERKRGPNGRFIATKPVQALTASASVIPTRRVDSMPRTAENWQTRAWRLWRLLGVVHFPTSFKANQVGRLAWNVEVNGELLEPEAGMELLDAITAPLGVEEAARRIALNLEVAGQVYYARSGDEWHAYAATTPKLKELLKASDIIVEGIQPDPEEPNRPTSSIQAALGTAEAIRLMAQMSRNQDRSRLAQRGILLVPKEGSFPEGDDFQANLEEAMTAPIADELAPSSVIPLKVDFPAEYIEKWRHLVLESSYDDKLMERIEQTVKLFAREIDMPVEVLLGNIDSNHWNAWISDDQNYSGHIKPLAVITGDVFAQAIMEAGAAGGEAVLVKVTPDPSSVTAHRPTVEDAFKAYEWGIVNGDFVRRALGADEDDMMGGDEFERLLTLKGLVTPEGEEPEPAPPMLPGVAPQLPEVDQEPIAAAVETGDDELDVLGERLAEIDVRLLSILEGQATMARDNARATIFAEKQGMQVVNEIVADEMHRLGVAWSRELARGRASLRALGIEAVGDAWDLAAEVSVDVLIDGMASYVIDSLDRDESDLPTIPTSLLRKVLAAGGGSETAVVAAIKRNPAPTFQDPQGFAIGVLSVKDLKGQNVDLVQWRFSYGPLTRTEPFEPHKHVDGQFMTAEGQTSEGWYPGDHKGCLCAMKPVFCKAKVPEEV